MSASRSGVASRPSSSWPGSGSGSRGQGGESRFRGCERADRRAVRGDLRCLRSQDSRGRILTDLGFRIPAEIDQLAGDQYYVEFSAERYDLLETDALVVMVEDEAAAEALRNDPLYSRLDVATQGRAVFLVDGTDLSDALSRQTVLSLPFLLDGLVPMLAAAIDGDPSTEVPS